MLEYCIIALLLLLLLEKIWSYLLLARCLKITEKVSFNIVSAANYVYILSGQKFLRNAKNDQFGEFLKTWSLRSNSVTRQVNFNRTKIGGKCQHWNIGWFSNNAFLRTWNLLEQRNLPYFLYWLSSVKRRKADMIHLWEHLQNKLIENWIDWKLILSSRAKYSTVKKNSKNLTSKVKKGFFKGNFTVFAGANFASLSILVIHCFQIGTTYMVDNPWQDSPINARKSALTRKEKHDSAFT